MFNIKFSIFKSVFYRASSKQTKKAFLFLPSFIFMILIVVDKHENNIFCRKK